MNFKLKTWRLSPIPKVLHISTMVGIGIGNINTDFTL